MLSTENSRLAVREFGAIDVNYMNKNFATRWNVPNRYDNCSLKRLTKISDRFQHRSLDLNALYDVDFASTYWVYRKVDTSAVRFRN